MRNNSGGETYMSTLALLTASYLLEWQRYSLFSHISRAEGPALQNVNGGEAFKRSIAIPNEYSLKASEL
jgi:hypothetical protein